MPGLGSIAPSPGVGGEGYQRLTPGPLNAYPPSNQRMPHPLARAKLMAY